MSWFPILLAVHITLAVALLAPSLLLPFLLRESDGGVSTKPLARLLIALQGTGSLLVAAGLALTGFGLLAILGTQLLSQPWLILALGVYAANLLLAGLVSRPNLRRLLHIGDEGRDEAGWQRLARRQRRLAYVMGAATGVIGLLMSVKPKLW